MARIWGTGIINSLIISWRNMLRGQITVHYPDQKLELPERARWEVMLKLDENGDHKCTACLSCMRACPNHIIDIRVTTREDRTKHIDAWQYELGACMMCGLCVEACPFDAIQMGHDYELARYSRPVLTYNLLEDIDAVGPKRKSAEVAPTAAKTADDAPSAATGAAAGPDGEAGEGA